MRWPRGSAWMPARTCSATRAAVKKPRHSTAGTNDAHGGGICLIAVAERAGSSSGQHEVPQEHLDEQRDVAEQLDVGVADRDRPFARRRAQDAEDRAEHERDDPAASAVASVQPQPDEQRMQVGARARRASGPRRSSSSSGSSRCRLSRMRAAHASMANGGPQPPAGRCRRRPALTCRRSDRPRRSDSRTPSSARR